MGFIYEDGKKFDDKLEALRQAEKALETARQLLSRTRVKLLLMPVGDAEATSLYGEITEFLGD